MAKKKATKKISPKKIEAGSQVPAINTPKLPPELEKKLSKLKTTLDKFKDGVLGKFGDYIVGITLLPPEKPKEGEKVDEKAINLLVVVDDTTSQKMSKDELHQKFSTIISKIAEDTDKNLKAQSVLLTDIWLNCYDGKFELNHLISIAAPIHDTGMLAAIKIAEIHKSMVIKNNFFCRPC